MCCVVDKVFHSAQDRQSTYICMYLLITLLTCLMPMTNLLFAAAFKGSFSFIKKRNKDEGGKEGGLRLEGQSWKVRVRRVEGRRER